MTEVEEAEDMKGKEGVIGIKDMIGIGIMTGIKGMKNDVRKEDEDGEHHYNAGYMRLNRVGIASRRLPSVQSELIWATVASK
jgi:hypothetical protein